MPIDITLRAFAEVMRDAEANEVVNVILGRLPTYEILSSKMDRYWKVHEWYELLLRLRARDVDLGPIVAVERVSVALGTGWTIKHVGDDDADALWRREDGGQFVDPRVTWANLQCFVIEK